MTDESVAVNTKLLNQTLSLSPRCLSQSQELFAGVPGEEFDKGRGQCNLPLTSLQ